MIAPNAKHLFRQSAKQIADDIGIHERILMDRISEKEKENPSAMGGGVSILHLHMSGLRKSMNVFIRLKNAIDMGAPDKVPVDLVCILLTPEREGSAYLRTFARLSRLLRSEQVCTKLRTAPDEKSIRIALGQSAVQKLAA